jgi:hypothetical protein
MEFRSQKAARYLILLALAPVFAGAAQYAARHEHLRKGCAGTLEIDEHGVSFREGAGRKRKHPHDYAWTYQDIQQLELAPRKVRVLTYKDNRWKFGADREFDFDAAAGADFSSAYALLKDRLDQRFVSALADADVRPLWDVPVKHLGTIRGSEGLLVVGEERIVFKTGQKADSRTWRYRDIDNISTSGPFELTLTTFERAKAHYGNRKDFNFQLKSPLDEAKYNDLWRRLNLRSNQ